MKKSKRTRSRALPSMALEHCPYCGSPVVLRSADGIYKENNASTMLYVCSRYPVCDAYVRVIPGTKTPIGSLANGRLRALRRAAHQYFDRLYLTGIMSRNESYEWLAAMLQAPLSQAHIGYLGEYYCNQVIEESKRMLENRRSVQNGRIPACRVTGGETYVAR
ncbi:MAG: DUF3268 family zinc-finger domain-containing protein [Firmicutes bacterium]|nr:DUF3268 family zinc-finger domain-containing protein [Bacillota bacterium]